ncbi:C-5 cytosine-specific DNA methylase [Kribbella voronezhensis]|uniref:DNA (cytosine-5-)-methyltransferase n=1 Tax=Kribbella voronezhensis TaxID=2512212 RepID=A0A4R7T8W0_9ACTN|nr:DNA cytosine methyltransferase [Kribbella voronezhensis]TDU87607.1 C-5 cytosine-specific DNA methylase [Kribbella voronezhensis]
MMATKRTRTAAHRPAVRRRRFRHDTLTALDLFSGFGGLTQGIEHAGFDVITAANHNPYKVEVHEANHPTTEHFIADLANPESSDYHDVRDLPAADLLTAGVSCVNHSPANTMKAYDQGLTLFDLEDPDYDERVTKSERDRATANCVLHYAAMHHPRLILVECTTELQSWGNLVPGKRKVGDGSTYRWWLKQFELLGYRCQVLFLNSMFFGVGQSRNRGFWAFSKAYLPAPDLEHRPPTWCDGCETIVEAVWTWKTGIPPTGSVCYGKQYEYRCPSCRRPIVPPFTPSLDALDLSNLGTRIGDKPIRTFKDGSTGPMAASTMARAERCRRRFGDFPAVLMPAKANHGSEKHPWQPMSTQTSQQETAILSTGALAVDNFQGTARGAGEPLPTQGGSETMALLSSGVVPFRKHTTPTIHGEAMPTVTSEQVPGVLFSGWYKQNGSTGTETAPHPVTDPLGSLTSRDTTALLIAEWREALADLTLEDCYFRMMATHEVGRGCGFDVTFGDHQGTYVVWGSARDQVDGYGNAVTPAIGQWVGGRMRAVLHSEEVAA